MTARDGHDLREAIKTLGMPVVVATILIWHILRLNKQLTDHNQRLVSELAALRELVNQTVTALRDNDRLLQQNERLVTLIRTSEQTSLALVKQLVEANLRVNKQGSEDRE